MNEIILNGLFCLVGVLVTIIVDRLRLKKKVITNYCTNKFSIGKELKNEFGKLEISYDNNIITHELKVYKGIIMNTGNEDIDNIPESGIVMKCPNNWVIKDRMIGNCSPNIKITCEKGKDDTETRFKPDMLKKGEGFSYSILYEVTEIDNEDESNSQKKDKNDIDFYDRIKDTKIKNEYMPLSKDPTIHLISTSSIFLVCFFLISMAVSYIYSDNLSVEVTENRTGETMYARINKDGEYMIADNAFSFIWSKVVIKKEEFEKSYSISLKNDQKASIMIFITALIGAVIFFLLWYMLHDEEKKRKMLQSFESNSISKSKDNN